MMQAPRKLNFDFSIGIIIDEINNIILQIS